MSCIEISYLGFNTTFVTVLLIWGKQSTYHHLVSIQLLLLFYTCKNIARKHKLEFQYNFCYCSIYMAGKRWMEHGMFQYNFCYCSMCSPFGRYFINCQFQYNFCYCSISSRLFRYQLMICFNTTFVTVLSTFVSMPLYSSIGFNTTFVTVL